MKKRNIIGYILSLFLLTGCFEDKGNYDYIELNQPVFTADPIRITTYQGDSVWLKAPFYFVKDSAEMLKRVRYEWKFNGLMLCEERDFFGIADTILKKLNLPFSGTSGSNGTYTIIDTKTGLKYMARTWVTIRPYIYQWDWLILSEKGADAKVSFLKKKTRTINNLVTTTWHFYDNYYETVNGTTLSGRPIGLKFSQGRNISVPNGSTSIITDQTVYTLNNENFKLHDILNNEFAGGTPPNFTISNVFHSRLITYIATQDGRLFRRLLTNDWFSGKFITEHYVIDSKGYKVTTFGAGQTAQGSHIFPCYDELNRRVLMIRQAAPYKIMPVTITAGATTPIPVWEMPEGTEILHLYLSVHKTGAPASSKMFTMIFNDASGSTWMADFIVNYNGVALEHKNNSLETFPAGNLPKGTKFLTCSDSYKSQYIFYTKGKELRYVNLVNKKDYPYLTFNNDVVIAKYATEGTKYLQLAIALTNGDFMIYDISQFDQPALIQQSKCNVGGKIVDIMELRIDTYYNAP